MPEEPDYWGNRLKQVETDAFSSAGRLRPGIIQHEIANTANSLGQYMANANVSKRAEESMATHNEYLHKLVALSERMAAKIIEQNAVSQKEKEDAVRQLYDK